MEEKHPKILISCVAENTPKFHFRVLTLFKTIKAFGGRLANEKLVAHFNQSINKSVELELNNLGVEVRLVYPFDGRSPHCNKIRMLEVADDFDVLVALDCDVVVVRDFSSQLSTRYFQAALPGDVSLSIPQWQSLFSYFRVPLPKERYETTVKPKQTIPYFNSGVLCIPKQYVKRLSASWANYASGLLNQYPKLGEIARSRFFTDQIALSLALAKERIPNKPLPIEMNLGTLAPIHPKLSPEQVNPFILHYFNHLDDNGLLKLPHYEMPRFHIEKVNSLLKSIK